LADSLLEGTGFEPLVPQKALGALHVGSPNLKSPSRAASQRYAQVIDIMLNVGRASRTEGSNPVPSSDESRANRVDLAHDPPARATGWYTCRRIDASAKSRAQPVATPRRTVYFAGSPWQWGQFVASGISMLWK
jgi:hypothetical protein